jgi:transposase-like protein
MTTTYETARLNHDATISDNAIYSADFKREAVRLAKGCQGLDATAKTLGIDVPLLRCWMESYPDRQPNMIDEKEVTTEQAEIGRLKDRLTIDEMELTVLEKTIGFFHKARR